MSNLRGGNQHQEVIDKNDIRFVVTGFGPFRNVKDNPTTVLANKLINYLRQRNDNLADRTQTLVIETSAEAARREVDALVEQIQSTQNSVDCAKILTTVVLHLGVNYAGNQFELESCAYNDADFRCPDEKGYTPKNESIVLDTTTCPIGTPLKTNLDVASLVAQLLSSPCGVGETEMNAQNNETTNDDVTPVVMSTDPGRFVCNYIYCYSLNKFQSSDLHKNYQRSTNNVKCLFMHVPPFSVASEEKQLDMVVSVMHAIQNQLKKL